MALIQCPECENKVSSTVEACPHCGYPLPAQLRTQRCPECGSEQALDAESCSVCGCPLAAPAPLRRTQICPECGEEQPLDAESCSVCGYPLAAPAPQPAAAAEKKTEERFSESLQSGLNKISGEKAGKSYITFGKLIKDGPKKRKLTDIGTQLDDVFGRGTPATTPKLADLHPEKASIWLFWYIMFFFIAGTAVMYCLVNFFQNSLSIPGLIFFGAIGTPLACMILFYEVDLFRSIPLYRVMEYFMIGAMFSWLIMMVGYTVFPQAGAGNLLSSLLVGVIEETAKGIITIVFIIREKRCRYILDGLLIGAAVGASYGAFETMGYILVYGLMESSRTGFTVDYILVLRGLLAPGMHVAWTALVGGAFMVVRGFGAKSEWSHVASPKFLLPFVTAVVIHGVWDTDLPLPMVIKNGLLTAVIWTILLYYINLGLKQLEEAKKRSAVSD